MRFSYIISLRESIVVLNRLEPTDYYLRIKYKSNNGKYDWYE